MIQLRGEENSSWLAKMMLNKYGIFTSGSQAEDLWTAAAGVYAGAIDTVSISFVCSRDA